MKYPKHPGIYAIRHIASDWAYIGSARNIYNRWRNHKSGLRRGVHHCGHLQNAWNVHGEAAFVFEVLETCLDDPTIIYHREQVWIDRAKSRLYNSSHQSEPAFGRKISEAHKQALREKMKGNKNGAGNSYVGVLTEQDVIQILYRYAGGDSTRDIAISYGVSRYTIERIARRKTWSGVVVSPEIDDARARRASIDMRGRTKAKIDYDTAEAIRAGDRQGQSTASLAAEFNITTCYVRHIVRGIAHQSPPESFTPPKDIPAPEPIPAPALPPLELGYRVLRQPRKPKGPLLRIAVKCDHCGKDILKLPCHVRANKRNYCGLDCRHADASNRMKEVMARPEARERLRAANLGKKATEETKAKMRATWSAKRQDN